MLISKHSLYVRIHTTALKHTVRIHTIVLSLHIYVRVHFVVFLIIFVSLHTCVLPLNISLLLCSDTSRH